MKRKKLYTLKMLEVKIWALDTTNLKLAERLDRCNYLKPGATYCGNHNRTHRHFIFGTKPTDRVLDAEKELKNLFELDRLDVKDYG